MVSPILSIIQGKKWMELEKGPSAIQRVSLSQSREIHESGSLGPKGLDLEIFFLLLYYRAVWWGTGIF